MNYMQILLIISFVTLGLAFKFIREVWGPSLHLNKAQLQVQLSIKDYTHQLRRCVDLLPKDSLDTNTLNRHLNAPKQADSFHEECQDFFAIIGEFKSLVLLLERNSDVNPSSEWSNALSQLKDLHLTLLNQIKDFNDKAIIYNDMRDKGINTAANRILKRKLCPLIVYHSG